MELAYLYLNIEDNEYSILNGEYNFSNKYAFEYTEKDGVIEISITENKNFIENFYGNNIVGITGIIGENGTGKTRLLKTIKDKIIGNGLIWNATMLNLDEDGEKEGNKKRIIISVIENNNVIIYYDHHKLKNIKLNTNLKNVSQTSYRDTKPNYLNVYLKELEDYPCIYYSNAMDFNYENLEEKDNTYNISSNYLIHKFEKYYKYKTEQILNLYSFLNSEYSNKYIKILRKSNIEKNCNSNIHILSDYTVNMSFKFNFNKSKVDDEIKEIIKKLTRDKKLFNIVNRAGGALTKLDNNIDKKERINEFNPDNAIKFYLNKLNRMPELSFILYNFYLYYNHIEKVELPKIKEEEDRVLNYYTNDLYKNYGNLNIGLLKKISTETDELIIILEEMKEEHNRIKENDKISKIQKQELKDLIDAFTSHLNEGVDIEVVYEALNKLENRIIISNKIREEIKKYKKELVRIFIEKIDVVLKYCKKGINEAINTFVDNWKCFFKNLSEYDISLIETLTYECELIKQSFKDEDIFSIINKMYNYGSKSLSNGSDSVSIDFEVGKDDKAIEYFISVITKNNYFSKMIQVDWRNFSSGEVSMLNLFSRFHNVKKEQRFKKLQNKSILILIDEVDLYFHPEWQRCIIKYLIDFLSDLFKDNKLQIILTSHSPFIISDIPKDNIIFFKKENRQYKVCDNDDFKQTFGANIHTLLTNSFFMDSTIGEFVNQKIKVVVKDLSGDTNKISEDRKKEIRYIIDNIGEPLIKKKLEDMYNKKFQHFEMNNKIEELSNKVRKLEKILTDNGLN